MQTFLSYRYGRWLTLDVVGRMLKDNEYQVCNIEEDYFSKIDISIFYRQHSLPVPYYLGAECLFDDIIWLLHYNTTGQHVGLFNYSIMRLSI